MVGRRAVSGDAATACLAGSLESIQPLEFLFHAGRGNVSHDRPQLQLFHQKVLCNSHLLTIAVGAKLPIVEFRS